MQETSPLMKEFKFETIIKAYATEKADMNGYFVSNKSEKELNSIQQDVDRSFTFARDEITDCERKRLQGILYLILTTIPVEYVQCMNQIASVIIYYFFHKSPDSTDSFLLDEETESLHLSDKLVHKCRVVLTNILKEKYEPLLNDDFKLYMHYNKVFIRMMKKRNVDIPEDHSFVYMNNTLNWFINSCKNFEEIKLIVGYLMATPTSFSFLILVRFFDKLNQSKPLNLKDGFYKDLIQLEIDFLKTEDELKLESRKFSIGKKEVFMIGSTVAICAAVVFAYMRKEGR